MTIKDQGFLRDNIKKKKILSEWSGPPIFKYNNAIVYNPKNVRNLLFTNKIYYKVT